MNTRLNKAMASSFVTGGALIFALGVLASAASSYFLSNKAVMLRLVSQTPTNFDPKLLWGEGGSRPLYMIVWSFVYASCAASVLFLIFYGLFVDVDGDREIFAGLVFFASAFFMSAAFTPVYQLSDLGGKNDLNWTLVVSTAIVSLCAIFAGAGVAVLESFQRSVPFALFVGVPTGVAAGWLTVAAGLMTVQTVTAYDGGHNEGRRREPEPGASVLPPPCLACSHSVCSCELVGRPPSSP